MFYNIGPKSQVTENFERFYNVDKQSNYERRQRKKGKR